MMRAALILFFCGIIAVRGEDHLPVRFWMDGAGTTWLTVYAPEKERGKALALDSGGARVAHFYFEGEPEGHFTGAGDAYGFEVFSPWWAKLMNIDRAPDAPIDVFPADFHFTDNDPRTGTALRVELSHGEPHLRSVAGQVAIRETVKVTPGEIARWRAQAPQAEGDEADEVPVERFAEVHETVYWPVFADRAWIGLADAAEAWLRKQRWATRVAQVAARGPDDGLEPASPWEIEWDLQWTRLSRDRATLLIHRRLFSRAKRSALGREVLNFRRGPDREWAVHDPLPSFGSVSDIREALREGLNAQGADGDYFAGQFPNLRRSDGQRAFSVWDLGDTLVCVIEAGDVDVPARGAIAVVLDLTEGPAAEMGEAEEAQSLSEASEALPAGELPFVDVIP